MLTEVEKAYNLRMTDFTFQLELTEEMTTRQVAQMFIDHGDVTVVKTGALTFWVDFESFDSEELTNAKTALGLIKQHIRLKHKNLIRNIREYGDALRFPKIQNTTIPAGSPGI